MSANAGSCKLSKVLDLPVTIGNMHPRAAVKINGVDAVLVVDTGASWNTLSRSNADQYKLHLKEFPPNLQTYGVNGAIQASLGVAKEFTIAGVTMKRMDFIVGGSEIGANGIIGRNLLFFKDLELDLANGMVRLMDADKCEHANLAYWVKPGGNYSFADLDWASQDQLLPPVIVDAYVNGNKIRAMVDSGATFSVLKLRVAERAGVKSDSPGVIDGGRFGGAGRRLIESYIGPFSSFKIGDEEIKNTRLRFADIDTDADMLLGADFMLSHHIYIAKAARRMFFTYNGGPVFNLNKVTSVPVNDVNSAAAPGAAEAPGSDAAELARQGTAAAARRDYAAALAALSKAIAINPGNSDFFYQRGGVYRATGQVDNARSDFDQALSLRPDFPEAYLARAQVRMEKKDASGAAEDLGAIDRTVAPNADVRYRLADFYIRLDRPALALAQYTHWMDAHHDDDRFPQAAAGRCYARVLVNEEISGALSDCNSALRNIGKDDDTLAYLYGTRALARFRQGDYKRALADANLGLKLKSKNPRALMARGLAEARLNQPSDSEQSFRDAQQATPGIAAYFGKYGLTP